MQTHQWCQKYKLDFHLDGVIDFFQKRMEVVPFMTHEDHKILARKNRYWDWFTRDIDDPHVNGMLDHIAAKHGLPIRTPETRIALWEYGEGDVLAPHVDVSISLSSAIIISLIGDFETTLHDGEDQEKVLDRVVYGPGQYIVLNNTKYYHGGRPLGKYRLATVAFVDPSFDMTNFWR